MNKVGNQTNSQDPQAVNSRVFVGNLNTSLCTKPDVERLFQQYGRIAGISMHKGFAFIQFTTPFDARSACLGEDGRIVMGQPLDVNMVGEPKPHQATRKRQHGVKTGISECYYAAAAATAFNGVTSPQLIPATGTTATTFVPALKRPRLVTPAQPTTPTTAFYAASPLILKHQPQPHQTVTNHLSPIYLSSNGKAFTTSQTSNNTCANANNSDSKLQTANLADLKSYSSPDVLICGNCREVFSDVPSLLEHKQTYCKLRFTCKCQGLAKSSKNNVNFSEEPARLLCAACQDTFQNAWDLLVHVQAAHLMNIYRLSSSAQMGSSTNSESMDDVTDDTTDSRNDKSCETSHVTMNGDFLHHGSNDSIDGDIFDENEVVGINQGAAEGLVAKVEIANGPNETASYSSQIVENGIVTQTN